jgi:DNA end-binding protein Ku
VIESLAGDFEPDELTSEYRRDLRALLEAKMRGEEIVAPEPEEEVAPVVDLMAALKASVAAAKKRPDGEPAEKKAARPRKARAKAS